MATAEFSKFAGILSAALSQPHLPGLCQKAALTDNLFPLEADIDQKGETENF